MSPELMNERVLAYQAGDRHAADSSYEAFQSYLRWVSGKYGDQNTFDGWDAYSLAQGTFAECLNEWNPTAGHKFFYYYAKQRIQWAVSNERNKTIHRQKLAYTSAASNTSLLDVDGIDREAQAEARNILAKLQALPEGRLRDIVFLKSQGKSNVEVGKELGLSNQYVSRLLNQYWETL